MGGGQGIRIPLAILSRPIQPVSHPTGVLAMNRGPDNNICQEFAKHAMSRHTSHSSPYAFNSPSIPHTSKYAGVSSYLFCDEWGGMNPGFSEARYRESMGFMCNDGGQ